MENFKVRTRCTESSINCFQKEQKRQTDVNMKTPQFFHLMVQSVQNPLLLTRPVRITSAEGRTGVSEVKEVRRWESR